MPKRRSEVETYFIILEFCQKPHLKNNIVSHLNSHSTYVTKRIERLLSTGLLEIVQDKIRRPVIRGYAKGTLYITTGRGKDLLNVWKNLIAVFNENSHTPTTATLIIKRNK